MTSDRPRRHERLHRPAASPISTQRAVHEASGGQQLAVAPQTVAEARYGALKAGWGAPRLGELDRLIRRARTLPVDIETIDRVARLRNDCRLSGHPLHQKQHNGDLWVAATAIRWGIPLVAHDGVFLGCPGLDLRTEIETGP